MSWKNILVAALPMIVLACAGASSSSNTSSDADTAERRPARVSPLGLGQPDPEWMFETALEDFERNDGWGFLSHFAFLNKEGKYFVRTKEDGAEAPDLRKMAPLAESMRNFLQSDWASVSYGRPVNVRNAPPTVEVPVTVTYRLNELSEDRKAQILKDVNNLLALRHGSNYRPITWEEYSAQVLNMPRVAKRRFVHIDRRWRFDAGWGVDRR